MFRVVIWELLFKIWLLVGINHCNQFRQLHANVDPVATPPITVMRVASGRVVLVGEVITLTTSILSHPCLKFQTILRRMGPAAVIMVIHAGDPSTAIAAHNTGTPPAKLGKSFANFAL